MTTTHDNKKNSSKIFHNAKRKISKRKNKKRNILKNLKKTDEILKIRF
jgi:hypothetical protein